MTADERRLAHIRRRIARFGQASIIAKLEDPGYALTCLSEQAFLLGLLDALQQQLAHPSTPKAIKAIPAPPMPAQDWDAFTPPTAVPIPALSSADAYNAALTAAEMAADTAQAEGIRLAFDAYTIQGRVRTAIRALRK